MLQGFAAVNKRLSSGGVLTGYGDGRMVRSSSTKKVISQLWIMIS